MLYSCTHMATVSVKGLIVKHKVIGDGQTLLVCKVLIEQVKRSKVSLTGDGNVKTGWHTFLVLV